MTTYASPPGMSLPADTNPILTLAWGPDLIRLWNRRANTVANCFEVQWGFFQNSMWAASTASARTKAVPAGYTLQSTDYGNDGMVPLSLARAILINPFSTADSEISIARRSPMSPTAVVDLKSERVFEAATDFSDAINIRAIQGNGVDPVTGAQDLVGLEYSNIVTGTYANQNVGTVTGLQGNVFGSDLTPVAFALSQIASDLTNIKHRSDEKPEFIVIPDVMLPSILNYLENDRRIFNQDNTLKRYSTGPAEAFSGADTGVSLYGIPVLQDKDGYYTGTPGVNAIGHIYYLTKKHNRIDIMPHFDVDDGSVWSNQQALSSGGWSEGDPLPWMFEVISLARVGLGSQFTLTLEVQVQNRRPMAQGIRKGISF